jgi:hypothetical protein
MARAKYVQSIIASTSNAATATERGTIDVRDRDGGTVTLKITNGGTGPTLQCEGRILIAHNTGSTPSAAAAGADWKTVFRFGGGTANSAVTETSWEFGPGVMHIEVEFTGNTGQAVTVEAIASTVDYEA